MAYRILLLAFWLVVSHLAQAASQPRPLDPDSDLVSYFRSQARTLSESCLGDVQSAEDWKKQREERRRQLFDMLGLWPLPPRDALHATVTGKESGDDFTVEKLHFQSMPGLYVTANLYLPQAKPNPAPAILYVCGHAEVKTNGVSFGNKTAYQHHGIWFARHGYVCLMIDTLQLGEIQGVHHGTHHLGQWWWNSRGYTPAGVEAWNCIRALDYLESRPEVDSARLGMTGRSGGGSYTWTTAALDERVKVAAPVAGMTDLENQVVDDCVDGHCDCMFYLNTYRWDFPMVAALIAPRPLLIANSDVDSIFPLTGVQRLHAKTKRVYELLGAADKLGLVITPGDHKDTQDLQVPVFRWFNQHLLGKPSLIEEAATAKFPPTQLRVFGDLPTDQRNTRIQETFVPRASGSKASAPNLDAVRRILLDQVFRGWPSETPPLDLTSRYDANRNGLRLRIVEFRSQDQVNLRLFLAQPKGGKPPRHTVLHVLSQAEWADWQTRLGRLFAPALNGTKFPHPLDPTPAQISDLAAAWRKDQIAHAWFAPRGIGTDRWLFAEEKQNRKPEGDKRKTETEIRRRFLLLGQTLDGMRVWDIRRALAAVRANSGSRPTHFTVESRGRMAVNALYASLFEPGITELSLHDLPASQEAGPDYLNILKHLDLQQAADLANQKVQGETR